MDRAKLLSGHELVARGITKIDASLPEVGLKDVAPNGTWLEQKQIQSALEARKHIIEVERIEKSGVLSHAKWREDLMLAEVTRNVGGHWQYFGHNIGKQLYLKPEEALFLIEVNCLRLTYNNVPVSMQQAYTLLLRSKISLLQYKVYASLSRIGYKVYRHEDEKVSKYEKHTVLSGNLKTDVNSSTPDMEEIEDCESNKGNEMEVDSSTGEIESHGHYEKEKAVDVVDESTDIEHIDKNKKDNEEYKGSDDNTIMNVDHCGTENADGDKIIRTDCLETNETDKTSEIHNSKTTINKEKEKDKAKDSDYVSCTESGSNGQDCIVNSLNENSTQIKLDTNTTNKIQQSNKCVAVSKETLATGGSNSQDSLVIPNSSIENSNEITSDTTTNNNVETDNKDEDVWKETLVTSGSNPQHSLVIPNSSIANSNEITSDTTTSNYVETDNKDEDVWKETLATDGSHDQDSIVNSNCSIENSIEITPDTTTNNYVETDNIDDVSKETSATYVQEVDCLDQNFKEPEQANKQQEQYHQLKIKSLENRKLRTLDVKTIEKCFEKVPDVSQLQIVTVDVPEEKYIPRNVFLNNMKYVLNLESIKSKIKTNKTSSTESRSYSANEEVNADHVRRIKATASGNTLVINHPPLFPNNRFNRPLFQNFWRPYVNFHPYNFIFRPFIPNNFFPRFRSFSPRQPLLGMYPRFTSFQPNEQRSRPNDNKRRRSNTKQKETQLEAIKHLAMRLKLLVQSGNMQQQNIDSLQRLITTFNTKYNTRLRLSGNFDVFNDETIVETITLDEEEEPVSKKAKRDDNKYKENFNKLKQLALNLKGLEFKEEINSRHRRAFSKIVKKFNKSYNADVYFNSDFEVIDRRYINLDSSSDSDCVIEETSKVTGSKKLKNPFNILKRLSKKTICSNSSNSKEDETELTSKKYSTTILDNFGKNWLPNEDDFGRAEILPKHLMNSYLLESTKEGFLYEFLNNQPYEFDNWVDIKLSFLKSIEETNVMIENDIVEMPSIDSLIGPDDCMDMPSVLKKLSIISTNKEVNIESNLNVDFDVYNRDVQNFRKSNRPKPHFRVICISESSSLPSGKEVASLHAKYADNTSIVFAVVGVGSISYLQMNPIDLPMYIPSIDLP